jgi:hypothetical protein
LHRHHYCFSAPLRSSQSYETELPPPHKAVGHSIDLPVAQSIAAGEADRFQVELTIDTYAYEAIYLLRMSLVYNGDDEHLELPLTVVGSGRNVPVAPPERIHADIQGFLDEVEQIRRLAAAVPAPDPESEAFAASMLLPWKDGLLRHPDIRSWAHPVESGPVMDDYRASISGKNVYVAVGIGNPKRVVLKSLGELADRYRSLADMIEAAQVRHQPLSDALPLLRCTLAALPQQRILYDAPGARGPGNTVEQHIVAADQRAPKCHWIENLQPARLARLPARSEGGHLDGTPRRPILSLPYAVIDGSPRPTASSPVSSRPCPRVSPALRLAPTLRRRGAESKSGRQVVGEDTA